jgi:peptidoglycan/xylan/chitin deacetylase (PgdA/CDA1 family)
MRAGLLVAGAVEAAHLLPSALTVTRFQRRWLPRLCGRSTRPHVALTFDDGPDPASTPRVLDALRDLGLRATFFVLGEQVAAQRSVARRIVDDGHELAVHGWRHVPHLLRSPWAVHPDAERTVREIRSVTGVTPRFWRPPNGVLSGAGLVAARRLRLEPVLWTADGRDWSPRATASSVASRVLERLEPGGTVLLHDSDLTSAPGSWRATLGALPAIAETCERVGWALGPLRDHWPDVWESGRR